MTTSKSSEATMHTETWYDDQGSLLAVTCDDQSCLVELTVETREERTLALEIVQVARDQRGLPRGCPTIVYQRQLATEPLPGKAQSVARCWLPRGFQKETLRNYYFRIRSVLKLDG